jgi:hypothetical protein
MKDKPIYIIYKTDKRVSVVFFFLMLLFALSALLPPINWNGFVQGGGLLLLTWIVLYLVLHVLSYISLYSDNTLVSSLLGYKKKTSVQNIVEIQRGAMYHGLSSIFGHQAFVIYRKEDGSFGEFKMSENLYSKKTMQALFKKLTEMNTSIKVDPYYKRLMDRKTFKW